MNLPEPTSFANRVKRARILKGLTQKEVADKLTVRVSTVANWETKTSEPYPRNLAALAKALGVSTEWLAEGETPATT